MGQSAEESSCRFFRGQTSKLPWMSSNRFDSSCFRFVMVAQSIGIILVIIILQFLRFRAVNFRLNAALYSNLNARRCVFMRGYFVFLVLAFIASPPISCALKFRAKKGGHEEAVLPSG